MIYYLLFILFLSFFFENNLCFNIKFIGGSFVNKNIYLDLLDNLKNKLEKKNYSNNYNFINYFEDISNEHNIILIGHSFGGFLCILKMLQNKNNNIKGCILLNSHFNENNKMPYISIKLKDINKKVLVILSKNDERLPFDKAIDDMYIRNINNISNINFYVNNGTHFSLFNNKIETELITTQIVNFIENLDYDNNYDKIKIHNSFLNFIKSRANYQSNLLNYGNNSILLKSNNFDIYAYLEDYYNAKINYNKIYFNIDNKKINKRLQILYILFNWFTKQPEVKIYNDNLLCDLYIIPIKDNIIYYKFPSKSYLEKKIL